MTRYFVNLDGTYLGAFDGDGVEVPDDAIEISEAPLDARQMYDGEGGWKPLVQDYSAIDIAALNSMLTEPGSVVRALGLVTFQEINKLRVKAGLVAYTMDQFISALKANMR